MLFFNYIKTNQGAINEKKSSKRIHNQTIYAQPRL